jgi:hypothetical protein
MSFHGPRYGEPVEKTVSTLASASRLVRAHDGTSQCALRP